MTERDLLQRAAVQRQEEALARFWHKVRGVLVRLPAYIVFLVIIVIVVTILWGFLSGSTNDPYGPSGGGCLSVACSPT